MVSTRQVLIVMSLLSENKAKIAKQQTTGSKVFILLELSPSAIKKVIRKLLLLNGVRL